MGLVLLDMDGTVRRAKSGAKFINNPYDQELMPGAIDALCQIHDAGHSIIGITNQGGVKAGFKSLANCIREQRLTIKLSNGLIDAIAFCPNDGESAWMVWADDREPSGTGLSYHGARTTPLDGVVRSLMSDLDRSIGFTVFRFQEYTVPHTSGSYRKPQGGMAQIAQFYWREVLVGHPVAELDLTTGPIKEFPIMLDSHRPLLMVGDMESDQEMAVAHNIPYRDASDWLLNPLP